MGEYENEERIGDLFDRQSEIQARIKKLESEISLLEREAVVRHETVKTSAPTDLQDADGNTIQPDPAHVKDPVATLENNVDYQQFEAPEWCIPIKANVMTFDWTDLAKETQFDCILMDPPWQLASSNPTRGVALGYAQLPDVCIEDLPIETLQENGFIFIWVINNKYVKAFEMMRRWGYVYCDEVSWVKQTVNRRMAKGHGYYLQHAKETCLVGRKGVNAAGNGVMSDVIYSQRRGQSQKPVELYEMIEELVPNGKYLEIFGRKNNLRDFWTTIGNEL